jgi:PAS domain S-box-containing protein
MEMSSLPIRVLLIIDDEADYLLICDLLAEVSYLQTTLKWVADYQAALEAMEGGKFDVCLLGHRVKGRSGLEPLKEAIRHGIRTPIIFFTGKGDDRFGLESLRAGAADYLTKDQMTASLLGRSIRYAMIHNKKQDELLKAQKVIQALSECNDAVIHFKGEADLLREICRIVVEVGGYRMAWVGYAEQDIGRTVTPVGKYGYEEGYLETVKVTWLDTDRGRGPTGTSIRTGVPSIVHFVQNDPAFAPWKVEATKRGYHSVIGLPLLLDGRTIGALTIYASEPDAFGPEEVELLIKLSGNLSYGIGALRVHQAHRQAEASLKEAYLDLERRVEERTADLVRVNAELKREVEERKQAEETLRLSEKSLRKAEAVAHFGNWEFMMGRNEVRASNGAKLIYGLEGTAWSIPYVKSIVLPEYRPILDDALRGLIEENRPYNVEFKIRRPTDGKIIDIHSIAEYSPEQGSVFGVIHDVTERKRVEEELGESEAKYRALIETTDTGFVIIDKVGKVLDANQEYVRLTGHRHLNEILGRSVMEWTADYQKEENALAVGKCFAEGYARNLEIDYMDSQGKVTPIEINATVVEIRGTPQILTLCRDITDRKQAEAASRTHIHFLESLELIDQAIKQETDVEKMPWNVMKAVFEIFVCDRAWLFYPCDPDAPSFRVPVEISRPEYPGAKALNREVPMAPGIAQDLRDALASEDPLPYTLGTEKPVNILTAQQFAVQAQLFMAIYPKIGKPWVFGMHQCSYPRIWSPEEQKLFKEIGRRLADGLSSVLSLREVKENEERFRATFEQAAVGMAHVAPDGRLLRVNRKLCDIVGYSRDELLQKTLQDIMHPDDLDADLENVRQVLTGEISTYTMEKRYLRKDASVVWINLTVSVVRHVSGDPDYFISVIEDITERKQAREERRRLEERLQRAEKMEALGTLAGGVAHDLNNVLGIVVGYSELLIDDLEESNSARSEAMEILKGGQRAAAIVQDLLTLARRGIQGRKALNLNNILLECQKSPHFANVFSYHHNIKIKTDYEADLLNLSGSSVHLEKSFLNLVSNAAEAMPAGGTLTIKTRNQYLDNPVSGYDEVKEGDYVVLSVSDTGEGIPASDLKRIFEPFYTKKVMGRSGTGLGLAVVWGTVKDHHGYINVESKEREGTAFTLYFPVTREDISPEQVSMSAAEYMGDGESILIVDDVKEQRELAARMLTKLNYRVTTVSSGEGAVEYLKQHAVDLIVLDMIMEPGMDGLDTYAKILEIHPHQKAIIVSGFSETERVSKAQALGAGTYVKKPYVLEKLGFAARNELARRA